MDEEEIWTSQPKVPTEQILVTTVIRKKYTWKKTLLSFVFLLFAGFYICNIVYGFMYINAPCNNGDRKYVASSLAFGCCGVIAYLTAIPITIYFPQHFIAPFVICNAMYVFTICFDTVILSAVRTDCGIPVIIFPIIRLVLAIIFFTSEICWCTLSPYITTRYKRVPELQL